MTWMNMAQIFHRFGLAFLSRFIETSFNLSIFQYMYDLKAHGYLHYEELDEMQRNEWAKKEKEKKERINK